MTHWLFLSYRKQRSIRSSLNDGGDIAAMHAEGGDEGPRLAAVHEHEAPRRREVVITAKPVRTRRRHQAPRPLVERVPGRTARGGVRSGRFETSPPWARPRSQASRRGARRRPRHLAGERRDSSRMVGNGQGSLGTKHTVSRGEGRGEVGGLA